MKPIKYTTNTILILSACSLLSALILSYTSLHHLFNAIGLFHWTLAYLFPLLFDLVEVAAAIAVFHAKLHNEEDEYAWKMVLWFTGLGIIANITHVLYAYGNGLIRWEQGLIGIFATSLFPLSVALVTHLVKRVISREIKPQEILNVKSFEELSYNLRESIATIVSKVDNLQQGMLAQNDQVIGQALEMVKLSEKIDAISQPPKKELLFELIRNKPDLKVAEYCKEIGISTPTYYNYMKDYQNNGHK